MNFGQVWRTEGIDQHSYEVSIPISFAEDLVQAELPELIEDYQQFPDPEDTLEAFFRQANWPLTVQQMREEKRYQLIDAVFDFFSDELLLRWFGDGEPQKESFVLNTVTSVQMLKDTIKISGTCRASHLPVKYQDV